VPAGDDRMDMSYRSPDLGHDF